MNRFIRLIFTVYILIITYLIMSFLYGNAGLLITRSHFQYNNRLIENISELEKKNNNLKQQIEMLKNIENVKLKAREIGYIADMEKKIHLSGIESPAVFQSLGKILYSNIDKPDNRIVIRSLSIIFALLFYIFSSIFIYRKDGNKKIR